MSSGAESGDQQDSGGGFVKSLVKALSGPMSKWTPGRRHLDSRSPSPTGSEIAHSLDIEKARALSLESRTNSTEFEVEIRSASRDENHSRQEIHQMNSNLETRKSEKLLVSDQNLLSDLQRISDFAANSGFSSDVLGERVEQNNAITGINFGEFRGEPVSQFRSVFSPHSRQYVVQEFPGMRDGVRFSTHHSQDQTSVYGGTEFSTRQGRRDSTNVTIRDGKRPKERARDRDYKQRFSMGSSTGVGHGSPSTPPSPPLGGHRWSREGDKSERTEGMDDSISSRDQPSRFQDQRLRRDRGDLAAAGVETPFQIRLVFEGRSVYHRVWATMPIIQLIEEASDIFGLESDHVTLILLSVSPTSLKRENTVSGPPRLDPNAVVMVFFVPPSSHLRCANDDDGFRPPNVGQGLQLARSVPVPILNSKLLASFKLPKFDGIARSWKAWDKAFQRFLGLHQLDHVLEEDFLHTVWAVQGARESNKIVFFLIEDAVAPGTLAAKLVRQATKWNGHEAYVLLRNGYVFSGLQTATILLSELSRIRLNRDEDASAFCLRLVGLIEDLELIPGPAAVFLTDTQKLGYLLSAIRHETSLQGVYVQLQSEQLRGTVSFDQVCQELHHRCEAIRADEFLDSRPGKALVSTEQKKKGALGVPAEKLPCFTKDCPEMIQNYLPLCKLCYLQCMAGKTPTLTLRDNLGVAVYNATKKKLDFPSAVPASRFPKKGLKKGRKVLMAGVSHSEESSSSSVIDQ
jgi:hypothetical protein